MTGSSKGVLQSNWICFFLGIVGATILAMFWFYPLLARIFVGESSGSSIDNGLSWSRPSLIVALIMAGWFMAGFLALLRPRLVNRSLPENANGLIDGKSLLFSTLGVKLLMWPAIIFASFLLVLPFVALRGAETPWHGWMGGPIFRLIAFLVGGLFLALLLARLFMPQILPGKVKDHIASEPRGSSISGLFGEQVSIFPFVLGLLGAFVFCFFLVFSGLLPNIASYDGIKSSSPKIGDDAANPATNPREPVKERGQDRDENRTNPTPLIDWDQHYLVLMGENHLPTSDVYSTPFITLFEFNLPGYVPSVPMGAPNKNAWCYRNFFQEERSNAGSGAARDAAEATSGHIRPDTVAGCPRDIGVVEAGAYVFDDEGTNLAGFDFPGGIHGYSLRSASDKQFVVFPEGGKTRALNPAVKEMKLSQLFVLDRSSGNKIDMNKLKSKLGSFMSQTELSDLPIIETQAGDYDSYEPENVISYGDSVVWLDSLPWENLSKPLSGDQGNQPQDVLVVLRGSKISNATEAESHKAKIQQIREKIRKQLDPSTKISVISLGSELPICADTDPECWSLNRSVSIYRNK